VRRVRLIAIIVGSIILVYVGMLFVSAFLFSSTIRDEKDQCFVGIHFQYSKSEIDQLRLINQIKNNLVFIDDPKLNFQFVDKGTVGPHNGYGGFILVFSDMYNASSTEIFMVKSALGQAEGVYEVSKPYLGCEAP
jgi:hypothetical protein